MSTKEKSEYRKKPSHGIYKTEIGCIFKCLKLLEGKYLILIYPKSKDTAPKTFSLISLLSQKRLYTLWIKHFK